MPNFAKLPTWADRKHIHAVVETPRGSRTKLKFESKLAFLRYLSLCLPD